MFRFRDGTPVSQLQHNLTKSKFTEVFRDEKFIEKWRLEKGADHAVDVFLFLLKNDSHEFKYNQISNIYHNLMREAYAKTEDKNPALSKFEKILRTITRNKYIGVQLGDSDPKKYRKRSIFNRVAKNLVHGETVKTDPDKEDEKNHIKLVKVLEHKYGDIVKKEMNNIRVSHFNFIKATPVKALKEKLNHPIYSDKIDTESLFKYISATSQLKGTKEDMMWLYGLIKIILKNGNQTRKAINEEREFQTVKLQLEDAAKRKLQRRLGEDLEIDEQLILNNLKLEEI